MINQDISKLKNYKHLDHMSIMLTKQRDINICMPLKERCSLLLQMYSYTFSFDVPLQKLSVNIKTREK